MMTFGFSQITDLANKAERFLKIAEAEGSFDTVAVIAQFPIRSLRLETLRSYGQVGFKPHRANAATLARKEHISVRVTELQEEQLAIHQQATAAAAANKQVTIESLIAEAEAARAKAMSEKGGAAAAVSALTAKAK